MSRITLKVAGESGMGLASVGDILARTLKVMGFYVHMDREYPSLIKGGHSNLQIDFGPKKIHSLSKDIDLVIALDRAGLVEYLNTVKRGGVLVHGYERAHMIKDLEETAHKRGVKLVYLPAREIAYSYGGNELMTNVVLLGLLWRVLGFDLDPLEEEVKRRYGKKPKILEIDLKCLDHAYNTDEIKTPKYDIKVPKSKPDTILLDGNRALALGAIHAGVRAYYAYPMSPSSSILTYMSQYADETGVLVKQVEDEISVAQMAVGSMFMGTRALCATSGGGLDLMTETISLAAMTETPFVVINCQRPGPATGLPTWTSQGDLNMAIHSAHGEFPRCVMAVSDPESSFELIQHALNIAEEYQIPVIVLSEKVICETKTMVEPFEQNKIPIKRGLVTAPKELAELTPQDRFKITKDGISKRWVPGSSPAYFHANSDEHKEDGVLTEDGDEALEMINKRLRKGDTLLKNLPEPKVHGPAKADISFVSWGSSKCTLLDAQEALKEEGITMNFLHYDYLWPVKTKKAKEFFKNNKQVHLIEGNAGGQFGEILEAKAKVEFSDKLLKYNGRPFFLEDVISYVHKHVK